MHRATVHDLLVSMGSMTGEIQIRRVKLIPEIFWPFDTCSLPVFFACENRVAVNRRTFPVERRESAFLIITGKASNANETSATLEPHVVSLLASGLWPLLFNLKTTLHSGDMADAN